MKYLLMTFIVLASCGPNNSSKADSGSKAGVSELCPVLGMKPCGPGFCIPNENSTCCNTTDGEWYYGPYDGRAFVLDGYPANYAYYPDGTRLRCDWTP